MNFFDTADSYGPYVDEELIAEAFYPYPKDLAIATKGGLLRPRPSAWDPDGRPEHLKRAPDGSLKRLKLDCIDVCQLHSPDAKVPFADSMLGAGGVLGNGAVESVAKELKAAPPRSPWPGCWRIRVRNAAEAIGRWTWPRRQYSTIHRPSRRSLQHPLLAACRHSQR